MAHHTHGVIWRRDAKQFKAEPAPVLFDKGAPAVLNRTPDPLSLGLGIVCFFSIPVPNCQIDTFKTVPVPKRCLNRYLLYIYIHACIHTYIHTYIHTHTVYGTNEAPGNPQCGQRHCYSCNWVNRRYKVLNDKTNTLNTRLRQYIVCLCYSSHLWYFHNN